MSTRFEQMVEGIEKHIQLANRMLEKYEGCNQRKYKKVYESLLEKRTQLQTELMLYAQMKEQFAAQLYAVGGARA